MVYMDPYLQRDSFRMARNRLLQRVTAPASEPLTLADAKLYLRIDTSDEDTLIGDLITASRMMAEHWLSRSLISQSWKLAFDFGIGEYVPLPMGPVTSIAGVTVFNMDNTSQAINSGSYWLNAAQNAMLMVGRVAGFRVEIVYNTGFGGASDVPKPIRQGMLAHIAAMYDNRGEATDTVLPPQTVALYTPYREIML